MEMGREMNSMYEYLELLFRSLGEMDATDETIISVKVGQNLLARQWRKCEKMLDLIDEAVESRLTRHLGVSETAAADAYQYESSVVHPFNLGSIKQRGLTLYPYLDPRSGGIRFCQDLKKAAFYPYLRLLATRDIGPQSF